jgi:type IV secretion system protein VirB10
LPSAGETGLAGKVNSHFFERFGSAMLLSVDRRAFGRDSAAMPGVVIRGWRPVSRGGSVGQSGQIGPTVRVRQGEPIRVFTARDLDFSRGRDHAVTEASFAGWCP